MTNYKVFFTIFLVLGLIGMIRFDEPIKAGDLAFFHINLKNDGDADFKDGKDKDLEGLSIQLWIYDLGIKLQTNEFDLDDHATTGKSIYWSAPISAKPGDYWVRITASNDDDKHVTHRLITII